MFFIKKNSKLLVEGFCKKHYYIVFFHKLFVLILNEENNWKK